MGLLLALFAGVGSDPLTGTLELVRGRAELFRSAQERTWLQAPGRSDLPPGSVLRLSGGSQASCILEGGFSLRIEGPAELEWCASHDPRPRVRLDRLRYVELEVRRDHPVLDLPSGWSVELERGAVGFLAGPSSIELVHHGGLPASVQTRWEAPDRVAFPLDLPPGGRLRLDALQSPEGPRAPGAAGRLHRVAIGVSARPPGPYVPRGLERWPAPPEEDDPTQVRVMRRPQDGREVRLLEKKKD